MQRIDQDLYLLPVPHVVLPESGFVLAHHFPDPLHLLRVRPHHPDPSFHEAFPGYLGRRLQAVPGKSAQDERAADHADDQRGQQNGRGLQVDVHNSPSDSSAIRASYRSSGYNSSVSPNDVLIETLSDVARL